jgi:FkbM family methyltransferase
MKTDLEDALSNVRSYDLNDYTVVVFGAGNTSVLYQKCFESEGIRPVYYVDNSEAKQGIVFQGVPVISVEKLVSLRETFNKPILVLICSTDIYVCAQIASQLRKHELTHTTVDAFVFKKNADKISAVCDLLEDERSRNVYIQLILSRISNTPIPESLVSNEQYFLPPQFIDRSAKEVFVDIGAYTGDTTEQYINKKSGVFGKIYAFEPDALNFSALVYRSVRLKKEWGFSDDKLTVMRCGIGAKTEQKLFASTQRGAENQTSFSARLGANFIIDKTENAEEVPIYALDDYFKEQRVGFIKADIESYELDMLRGAQSVIKRDRPILAVCIYHGASDMFTIPLFINGLCEDYKLKIRQYSHKFDETVLYAYRPPPPPPPPPTNLYLFNLLLYFIFFED